VREEGTSKIPRAINFPYKTGAIRREQNLSLGLIHMFLGIHSSSTNTYYFLGKQINCREPEGF
jgi:hypothetical protein